MASVVVYPYRCWSATDTQNLRETNAPYIKSHFSEQLTDPEGKKRRNFSQFGYGLSFFTVPLFPITDFIEPNDYGLHSFGKPDIKEKNGSLYTCRGGFIDFSHMRAAADWAVFLTFKIITEPTGFDLPHEGGDLRIDLRRANTLSLDDIAAMAQKIAFERLEWHEIASWHYHQPNYTFNEQQSTFTPEDTYSNFLGTRIGRNIALRILTKRENLSYSEIASDEIQKMITALEPVRSKKETKEAYDIVDRAKQMELPAAERNKDVWWDSKVIFRDERYVFKRYINMGPSVGPWLVPHEERLGCLVNTKGQVWQVPAKTKSGISFYRYYTFTIRPDSLLFYSKNGHKQLHPPFGTFASRNMGHIRDFIAREMQKQLTPGFSRRDKKDPEKYYKKLKKVIF
ncbi:MAG: DUF4056 domain-containing protein [Bacteroidetes bacterium]|nr:DUF4056 domain-containing protein [Bacteroidota bacterium]